MQVAVPEEFTFHGRVPFDMHIVDRVAFVTVFASSVQDATVQAENYFARGVEDE